MSKIVFNCLKSAPDHSLNLIFIIKDFALKIFSETADLKNTMIVCETVESLIKEDLAF